MFVNNQNQVTDLDSSKKRVNFSIVASTIIENRQALNLQSPYHVLPSLEEIAETSAKSRLERLPFALDFFDSVLFNGDSYEDVDRFKKNTNLNATTRPSTIMGPVEIENNLSFVNTSPTTPAYRFTRFRLRTTRFLTSRPTSEGAAESRNKFYQFNVSVVSSPISQPNGEHGESPAYPAIKSTQATVQIVVINRDQLVKLVFSQPLARVVSWRDEIQEHLSDLTGFTANVDKIR